MKRGAFVTTASGLVAGAALLRAAPEVRAAPAAWRVDVHHHCLPPFFADAVKPQSVPANLTGWTPARSLADMDTAATETAVLSMPRSPSGYTGAGDASRALARQINEFMAGVCRNSAGRFRFWAEVPLPDVDGAVREAAYALDTLGADGIGVATSYGPSWLGDAKFAPLWNELNVRKAIVFAHPLADQCCLNLMPGLGDALIEYGTDTTRTIASIAFSGTAARYPDVRFIFCHAGGTAPYLIDRFRFQARDPKLASALPHGIDFELQKFYYETAQAATPETIGALMKLVPASHVLFGTDYPYRKSKEDVDGLDTCGLRPAELQAIGRTNALALLAHTA
jgi:predicted TIM-barrel fold metal-dependent hydrolase